MCLLQGPVVRPGKNHRTGDIWNRAHIQFMNHLVYRIQLAHTQVIKVEKIERGSRTTPRRSVGSRHLRTSRGPWSGSGSSNGHKQEVALCSSSIRLEWLQQSGVSPTAKGLQVTGLSGLIWKGLPVCGKCYSPGSLASINCPSRSSEFFPRMLLNKFLIWSNTLS